MDLWDMTKLLFRRWYFSLPMLLVTLALVAVAAVTVKPDYTATGHIQFIPPVGTVAKDGEKNPIDNPWYDLGYEALANATVIDVTKKSVLEDMIAAGLSDNITVTVDQVPLFVIEAVGETPEQATATVQYVQKAIGDAVQQRHETLRVADTEIITTLQLDDGSEVEEKSSKIMRVMVVAGGLGLLLTAGFTIGLDALLRWRNRRRNGDADEPAAGSVVGSAPLDKRGGAVPSSFEATQTIVTPRPPNGVAPKPAEPKPAVPANGSAKVAAPAPPQRRPSDGKAYRSSQAGNPQAGSPQQAGGSPQAGSPQQAGNHGRGGNGNGGNPAGADPRLEQAPADATIVLPPWGWKQDEKAKPR